MVRHHDFGRAFRSLSSVINLKSIDRTVGGRGFTCLCAAGPGLMPRRGLENVSPGRECGVCPHFLLGTHVINLSHRSNRRRSRVSLAFAPPARGRCLEEEHRCPAKTPSGVRPHSFLYGGNAAYIESLHARYEADPARRSTPNGRRSSEPEGRAAPTSRKSASGPSWKRPNWPHADGELVAALDRRLERGREGGRRQDQGARRRPRASNSPPPTCSRRRAIRSTR